MDDFINSKDKSVWKDIKVATKISMVKPNVL